ncbi:MAG: Fe-S cluster assembly scaffold SufA [Bacteroidia bacterium]|nr:MAG: Fe-S cluster assembly scaffold SufA [Bacteroidia bacterium]
MEIHVTPSAAQELKRLLATNPQAAGIRLKVEAGGCAGLTYKMEITTTPLPSEVSCIVEGIPFYIEEGHTLLLSGIEIDYPQGLLARGFVFHNPQAKSTCGCGTSFSV